MQRTFAAIVQRTSTWDNSKSPEQQIGFEAHLKYMSELEACGFIIMAGLMHISNDVLFVLQAEDEEEARTRLALDPWRQDGHTRLARLEEISFRTGAPRPVAG